MSEKRESAEKRAASLIGRQAAAHWGWTKLQDEIARQIKEAEAQARAEGLDDAKFMHCCDGRDYEKGWIACREAAANEAKSFQETLFFDRGQLEKMEWVDRVRATQRKAIAERINSLQPPSEAGRS